MLPDSANSSITATASRRAPGGRAVEGGVAEGEDPAVARDVDRSVQRGEPAVFGLNQVIPGWREGIPLMQVGAKYRFTVPPHLAYGAQGAPPKIGPNQTLMFDVELFEVLY